MTIKTGFAVGMLAAATLAFAPHGASAENMNPELLGASCVVCHGPEGHSVGDIPAIAELSAKVIGERMREFRDGKRAGVIMDKIAKGYSEAQLDLIANHFGAK